MWLVAGAGLAREGRRHLGVGRVSGVRRAHLPDPNRGIVRACGVTMSSAANAVHANVRNMRASVVQLEDSARQLALSRNEDYQTVESKTAWADTTQDQHGSLVLAWCHFRRRRSPRSPNNPLPRRMNEAGSGIGAAFASS